MSDAEYYSSAYYDQKATRYSEVVPNAIISNGQEWMHFVNIFFKRPYSLKPPARVLYKDDFKILPFIYSKINASGKMNQGSLFSVVKSSLEAKDLKEATEKALPFSHVILHKYKTRKRKNYRLFYPAYRYLRVKDMAYTLSLKTTVNEYLDVFKYYPFTGLNADEIPEIWYKYFEEILSSKALDKSFTMRTAVKIEDKGYLENYLADLLKIEKDLYSKLDQPVTYQYQYRLPAIGVPVPRIINDYGIRYPFYSKFPLNKSQTLRLPVSVQNKFKTIIKGAISIVTANIQDIAARVDQINQEKPLTRTAWHTSLDNPFMVYNPTLSAQEGKPVYTNVAQSPALDVSQFAPNITDSFIPQESYLRAPDIMQYFIRDIDTSTGVKSQRDLDWEADNSGGGKKSLVPWLVGAGVAGLVASQVV